MAAKGGETINGEKYPKGTYIRILGKKVEIVIPKRKPKSRARYSS